MPSSQRKVCVLIVDDDRVVAKGLRMTLDRLGYEVPAPLASGEEAVEGAGITRPDIVLMDIRLQGAMDGVAAAEHIRSQHGIPVVFLTALADEATLQRAKLSEPFGYVVKPFDQHNLQSVIEMALHKHRAEQRLKESEQRFASTLRCLEEAVIVADNRNQVTFLNPVAERLTGWTSADALSRPLREVYRVLDPANRSPLDRSALAVAGLPAHGVAVTLALVARDGSETPVEERLGPLTDIAGRITGVVAAFHDITERRRAEREREQLIDDLTKALAEVKTLSGLLPICAYCKKVRDDGGYWNQIEEYVASHTRAQFSHGICPDCRQRHFPQLTRRPSGPGGTTK